MKKLFLSLMTLTISALTAAAAEPIELKVWPDGAPNPMTYDYSAEDIRKNNLVEEATLLVFPAKNPNGQAIVACPGGGYGHLAKFHEGTDMADWFNAQGITYAVLLYRMPEGHPDVPLGDAQQAIRIMRAHAEDWGVRTVGIMGASAGGHLAATTATHSTGDARPDFQILFYPVVSMDPAITHMGSHDNFLGKDATKESEALYSNELQVTPETPVAFVMHSSDDRTVPLANTLRYVQALTDNKVYSSLHVYPVGGHGWGYRDSFPYKAQWTAELKEWLRNRN